MFYNQYTYMYKLHLAIRLTYTFLCISTEHDITETVLLFKQPSDVPADWKCVLHVHVLPIQLPG